MLFYATLYVIFQQSMLLYDDDDGGKQVFVP